MRSAIEMPLALLSATCYLLTFAGLVPFSPFTGTFFGWALKTAAVASWVAFPAVFNFLKGLGRSSIARSWKASLILSVPSAMSVALVVYFHLKRADAQDGIGIFLLPLAFLIILPLTWAAARAYHNYWEPRPPNNSSKPTPLRGAA